MPSASSILRQCSEPTCAFLGQGGIRNSPTPSGTKSRVAADLGELRQYAGPHKVTVILESHDHFTASATLKEVLRVADSEHVGLLWETRYTFATSNEDPAFAVHQLGPWIRHPPHLKIRLEVAKTARLC